MVEPPSRAPAGPRLRWLLPGRVEILTILAVSGCPTFPPPLDTANTLGDGGSSGDGGTLSSDASTADESAGASSESSTGAAPSDAGSGTTSDEPMCASTSPATVGQCDPYAQDCPAGQKCLPWADDGGRTWNSTRCSAIPSEPAQDGEPCVASGAGASGQDSCDLGLMCWLVDPTTLEGTCRELCKCGPNEGQCFETPVDCAIFNDGALPICLPHCDPLASTCAPEEVCIPTPLSAHPACTTDASGRMGAVLDPCLYPNTCDAGLWCAPAAEVPGCTADSCCTPVCDLDAPDCSALPGTACDPWYAPGEAPEPSLEHIGLCRGP